MRVVLLGLLALLMLGIQQLHAHFPAALGTRAAVAFGFLLLVGFLLGELTARFVPRITGYLLAGMLCGPYALGMVDVEVIGHLDLLDELALVLIAYTAGAEIDLGRLKERARGILCIALVHTLVVFAAVTGGLFALRDFLPVFAGLSDGSVFWVAALLGIIATAKSPSTTVAVIVEVRAKGPMTDTVLGATVLKDIVVLASFSMLVAAATPVLNPSVQATAAGMGNLLLHVLLSLVVGAGFGGLMIAYLRFIDRQRALFVIGSAFLLISLTDAFGLDPLLSAVAAGFVVSNFSRQGKIFRVGLERAAGPIFLIFFCLAGAGLNLSLLASLWRVALIYLTIRTVFTWIGCWLGATLAADPPAIRRYAWTGFIGQAGVSLGLATMLRSRFGEVGGAMADLVVGGIVVNQILGPVAFRWALRRAGEARESRGERRDPGREVEAS